MKMVRLLGYLLIPYAIIMVITLTTSILPPPKLLNNGRNAVATINLESCEETHSYRFKGDLNCAISVSDDDGTNFGVVSDLEGFSSTSEISELNNTFRVYSNSSKLKIYLFGVNQIIFGISFLAILLSLTGLVLVWSGKLNTEKNQI